MEKESKKGFSFYVGREQIKAYRLWPIERRLAWLYQGNVFRRLLPSKIIKRQEDFRKGRI